MLKHFRRRWYIFISGILIPLSLAAMVLSRVRYEQPLRIGIDFTQRNIVVVESVPAADEDGIHEIIAESRLGSAIVQAPASSDEYR